MDIGLLNQMMVHKKCLSNDPSERKEAIHIISTNYQFLNNKDQAWSDLIMLFQDEDEEISAEAAYSLGLVYSYIQDKEQAWLDLIGLAHYADPIEENIERIYSSYSMPQDQEEAFDELWDDFQEEDLYSKELLINTLGFIFAEVPNREKAWSDLINLAYRESHFFSESIGEALGSAFPYVSDKEKSWSDLIRLSEDCIGKTYGTGAIALSLSVFHFPDKGTAWLDLLQLLTCSPLNIGEILARTFEYLSDKEGAWRDLIRLTECGDKEICEEAAYAINLSVSHVPNKDLAWADLLRLSHHENNNVKNNAVDGLGQIIPQIHDKDHAWLDLIELMHDENPIIDIDSADVLNLAFPYVSDTSQAWLDIHGLIHNKNYYLRSQAGYAISANLSHAPDKETAWSDLHILTKDSCYEVREVIAYVLGFFFAQIPNKSQAFADLCKLTQDPEANVKYFANYSLGKISIIRASESENEESFKNELERAIGFFEKSSVGFEYENPAKFCLPFYRSFYMILFGKQKDIIEIKSCINKAKDVTKGSRSRKELLEVIECLSNALNEVRNYHEMGLDLMKCDLDKYRKHCERAMMLLALSGKKAPIAAKVLKKGLPLIDRKIKNLLDKIEYDTKNFCRAAKDTPIEQISRLTYERAKGLSERRSVGIVDSILNRLTIDLRNASNRLPKEVSGLLNEQLKNMDNLDLFNKGMIISSVLNSITLILVTQEEKISQNECEIRYLRDLVIKQSENINYNVFKLKLTSSEMKSSLHDIEKELIKLNSVGIEMNKIGLNLNQLEEVTRLNLDELNCDIIRIIQEMESNISNLPQNQDSKKILQEIRNLKPSRGEMILGRLSDVLSVIGFILQLYSSNPRL